MGYEYLTAEYRLDKPGKPLIFRFADNSSITTNYLQEFLNRQTYLGWKLLAAVPLAFDLIKPPKVEGAFVLTCCQLIFERVLEANYDNGDTTPAPGDRPRKLKPV
jgi:hypothetical protein